MLFNITPIPYYLLLEPIIHTYEYSNCDGTFRGSEVPEKGLEFSNVQRNFEHFQDNNPNNECHILYRNFNRNWLKFWKWRDYLTHERWKLPFRDLPSR